MTAFVVCQLSNIGQQGHTASLAIQDSSIPAANASVVAGQCMRRELCHQILHAILHMLSVGKIKLCNA